MSLKSMLRGTAVATLLLAVPVLAQTAAPTDSANQAGQCEGRRGRHGGGHKFGRMEQRLDKRVAEGRLTQAQADSFKAEARQLHEEMKAARASANGQVDEARRAQFKERRKALKEKIKAALAPTQQGA